MADERRYGEEEVGEIFALAAREGGASLPALAEDQEGLTLGELQEVGREVGLSPERVADAAASLDVRAETLPRRSLMGAPVSVGRVVDLPRAATDREWQYLVAELRQTFDAKGEVRMHGDVREWTNGNLHAVLEETEAGHRLRMGTRKGNATEFVTIGFAGLAMSLIMLLAFAIEGKLGAELMFPALFGLGGAAALTSHFRSLPKWADERERQIEHIANRARALLSEPPPEERQTS